MIDKLTSWRFFPALAVAVAVVGLLCLSQLLLLRRVHSTFDNYYSFRGCQTLLSRTADSGTCRLADGSVIKMVQFRGRWYLDGDLPTCISTFCF